MKSRIDVEAITSKMNLDELGHEIITRSEKGEFRSQSPITVVLERLRPALMKARENKASFSALARYLNEKQIPISEATLRKYLNQYSDRRTGARATAAQRQKLAPVQTDKTSTPASKFCSTSPPTGVPISAGKPDAQRTGGVTSSPRSSTPNIPKLAATK